MNRTQKEIDEQNESLMHEIEALNMDIHDNCDLNDCEACMGKSDSPNYKRIYK